VDDATDTQDSILPALAFSLDMFAKTAMSFGVNQVLLAAVLGSMIFAVFPAHLLRVSVQLRTLHLGPSASGPFGTLLCCFLNYCGSAPPFPLHKRSLLLDFPFLSSFSCRFATFLLPQFFTSEELALLDAPTRLCLQLWRDHRSTTIQCATTG